MQKMGMTSELQAMWCVSTDGHDDRTHLEQVFDLICCHPSCQYLIILIETTLQSSLALQKPSL